MELIFINTIIFVTSDVIPSDIHFSDVSTDVNTSASTRFLKLAPDVKKKKVSCKEMDSLSLCRASVVSNGRPTVQEVSVATC